MQSLREENEHLRAKLNGRNSDIPPKRGQGSSRRRDSRSSLYVVVIHHLFFLKERGLSHQCLQRAKSHDATSLPSLTSPKQVNLYNITRGVSVHLSAIPNIFVHLERI